MFWKTKTDCAVYAGVFLVAAGVSWYKEAEKIYPFSAILFGCIGLLNLIFFSYKTYKNSRLKAATIKNTKPSFTKTKWKNGLYGLFFTSVGLILLATGEVSSHAIAFQLAMLFGGVEVFIFILKNFKTTA